MEREALKLALEALEAMQMYAAAERKGLRICDEAITAIKEALAQPAQEPVAYVTGVYGGRFVVAPLNPAAILPVGMAFYATAPQPAQDPVAWRRSDKHRTAPNYEYEDGITSFRYDPSAEPLYTTPPNRPWAGLTDEEIKEIVGPYGDTPIKGYTRKLFDQIEAKLRSKNNG